MDHHCPWVSNCVGKRNYKHFFIFANVLWVNCLFVIITSAADIKRRVDVYSDSLESSDAISEAFKSHPLSIPILVFCFLAQAGISILIYYHYKITFANMTTHEDLKQVFRGYQTFPFDAYSAWNNFTTRIISNKIPINPHFQPTLEAPSSSTKTTPKTSISVDKLSEEHILMS